MHRFAMALCLLGLSACATPEQLAAEDAAACQSYGFTRGTDAFATCMMTLDQQRKGAPPRVGVGLGIGVGGRF